MNHSWRSTRPTGLTRVERAYFRSPMTQLRTMVLMKTDIAGSTPRFRALLVTDLQTFLFEHQAFVVRHAADQGGQILKPAGDGYWLEFPSVTAAAKSAIAMQEALRLAQSDKGDDRLSMRVVIGLGDVAPQQGDLIGEVFALVVRIEAITPADEIYLTAAARLALMAAEIQTALVDTFLLKGFPELIPVYRVVQQHRTHIITNAYILISDLRGFRRFTETAPVATVERMLDTLAVTHRVAREFGGTIRYSMGDAHCLTFPEATQLIAAAERLSRDWEAANRKEGFGCAINVILHRGTINMFQSFLYGKGMFVISRVERASKEVMADSEGGVFVTSAVRDDLSGSPWHNQLQRVALTLSDARLPSGLEVYRLDGASLSEGRESSSNDDYGSKS